MFTDKNTACADLGIRHVTRGTVRESCARVSSTPQRNSTSSRDVRPAWRAGLTERGHRCHARPALGALAQQEVERRPVEGLGIFVQAGVRQVLEDDQLAAGDPALQPPGEAR